MIKKSLTYTLIVFSLTALFGLSGAKVEAVSINNAYIPAPYQSHTHSERRLCRATPSSPIHLHGQAGWISRASDPRNISPISVPYGTNSINLRWNVLSNNCTENMSPRDLSGNIANTAIQTSRYHIDGASSNIGTVSGFDAYKDTNYSNTYGSPNLYYVKESSNPNAVPVHDIFTLSNIGTLPPGTHTVTVTIQSRVINGYRSGYHSCVAGGDASGLNDTSCGRTNAPFSFQITVEPPPVTVRGRVFRHPSQTGSGGASGVRLEICDGDTSHDVVTAADGSYSFTLPQGSTYCIRVHSSSAQPSSTYGAAKVRPWGARYGHTRYNCPGFGSSTSTPLVGGNNYCTQSGYEYQQAGTNAYTGCATTDFCSLDRSTDSGFDIIYPDAVPPTIDEFVVECDGNIRLTVTTDTGNPWAARLFIDGDSTFPLTEGRFPSSGTNPSGFTDTSKTSRPWHDVRAHSFRVRVDDTTNSSDTSFQTWSATLTRGPCIVPTCEEPPSSLTFSPNNPEPNQDFEMNFTLGFLENYGAGNPTTMGHIADDSFNFSATYGNTGPPPGFNPSTGTGASTGTFSRRFSNIRMPNPGTYYGEVTINTSPSGGPTIVCTFGEDNTGVPPCPVDCDFSPPTSYARPFIQAFRGDVKAGAPIAYNNTCNVVGAGTINAVNQGPPGYKGSGSQLAAMARTAIASPATNFITAHLINPDRAPDYLVFNNVVATDCNDFYQGRSEATHSTNGQANFIATALPLVLAGSDLMIDHTGDLALPGGTVGGIVTIYVDGDLALTGNVNYSSGPYSSIADIPKVRFVVKGDIYISHSVSNLEGTFIALPRDDGSKGNIYTCDPSSNNYTPPTNAEIVGPCTTAPQLKVFGSVFAKKIFLHRLNGTAQASNPNDDYGASTAAEVFIESPLHWLALPGSYGPGTTEPPRQTHEIRSLPPVL